MAAGVSQVHRVVRRDGTQKVVGLEAFDRFPRHGIPFALVPAPSGNPFPGLCAFDFLGNRIRDLLVAGGIHQVQVQFVVPKAHKMPVAFDQAGSHGFALQVHQLGLVSLVLFGLLKAASKKDFIAFGSHGFHRGLGGIHRIDGTPVNKECGGFSFRACTGG